MLSEIKKMLIENPGTIVELLEEFCFSHINLRTREIRFARDDRGGSNISIRLENNDNVFVSDYARGVSRDIFSYIIQEKNVTFRDVLQATKRILSLDDDWRPPQKKSLFGGIYDGIASKNKDIKLKTYDESILKQYDSCGNLRFLRDGISLEAQRFWGIGFVIEESMITIPIRDEFGTLIGCKSRINWEPGEDESKYLYLIPTMASQTLFGYADNYSYLYGNDVIVVESEKSVMQAWTFGVRNVVALGSNSLSDKQAKLLLQLNPKRIILAMDDGLEFNIIKRNADTIASFGGMIMPEVWYWNSLENLSVSAKDSPTDNGKEVFDEIMADELVRIY